MGIIQDEGKRMVAHLENSLDICMNYDCETCPTKDPRLYENQKIKGRILPLYNSVKEESCVLGLAMGKRIEQFGKKNKDLEYRGNVIGLSRSLQEDSVKKVNSKKIQNGLKSLISYLDQDGSGPVLIPSTLEEVPQLNLSRMILKTM